MAKKLYKYDGSVNAVTWFTTWNYALRNYYTDDVNYVPDPVLNNQYNTYVEFRSRQPGFVNVDWGDGNKEQIAMTYNPSGGYYTVMFRSLNIEYRKNPAANPWWFKKSDGTQYVPVAPHHYEDDRTDIERAVVLDFTCDIYYMYVSTCHMTQFPVVDIPGIEYLYLSNTKGINSVPQDRLARATKLADLGLDSLSLGSMLPNISEGITNKTYLTSLTISQTFDFSDLDASGARRLGNLKNLTYLAMSGCNNRKYFKELNDIPNLKTLKMCYGGDQLTGEELENYPDTSEVTQINQSLTELNLFEAWYSGAGRPLRTKVPDTLNGKGVGNIESIIISFNTSLDYSLPFPDWFYEARSVNTFINWESLYTQEQSDAFVGAMYRMVTEWDQSTMSAIAKDGLRNQWYGLFVGIYNGTYNNDKRPSGVEQAPEGFVKGSVNGNPTTPMEMIYVLKNNYAQTWNIPPA